jgi:putative serine protease PepD
MAETRSSTLAKGAVLLGVAVAGGAVALVGAWLFGGPGGQTSTVRQLFVESTTPPPPASVASTERALSIGDIYRLDSPGVVQITAMIYTQSRDPIFGTPNGFSTEERALGSGFVLSKEGYILTSYHVVHRASSIRVSFSNNDSLDARMVGGDPTTDIAVLKVGTRSRALTPLHLGDSDAVRVGDTVVALGNPFGYSRSVTAGIVSGLQRRIQSPNAQPIDHVIQTDAAINQGNSGGPLIDARGSVIGVNTAISTGTPGQQGNVGVGFAIPINTIRTVVAQLIKTGKAVHPYIGATVQAINPDLARLFGLPLDHGLLVQDVYAGSPAAKAGLRGGRQSFIIAGESYQVGGDIISAANGVPVNSETGLRDLIAKMKPGQTITLRISRRSTQLSLKLKIGRLPATTPPSLG